MLDESGQKRSRRALVEPARAFGCMLRKRARRTSAARRDLVLALTRDRIREKEQERMRRYMQFLQSRGVDELTGGLYEIEESEDEDEEERVEKANISSDGRPRDVLVEFPDLCRFKKGDSKEFRLKMYAQNLNLPEGVASFCLSLTESNMKEMYAQSAWKWSQKRKFKQLFAEASRLIVAHDVESGDPKAFAMFRFLLHADAPVLYLYELQVCRDSRGQGLGTHFLKLLEKVAAFHKMDWIMLTSLNCNVAANQFYLAQGFQIDETSPDPEENRSYQIYSKQLF